MEVAREEAKADVDLLYNIGLIANLRSSICQLKDITRPSIVGQFTEKQLREPLDQVLRNILASSLLKDTRLSTETQILWA